MMTDQHPNHIDNQSISITVNGQVYRADTDVLDRAMLHYSLANEIQLRALLTLISDGTEEFSNVLSRAMLLIMICDLTGNTVIGVAKPYPAKRQAAKIISDAKRAIRQEGMS